METRKFPNDTIPGFQLNITYSNNPLFKNVKADLTQSYYGVIKKAVMPEIVHNKGTRYLMNKLWQNGMHIKERVLKKVFECTTTNEGAKT